MAAGLALAGLLAPPVQAQSLTGPWRVTAMAGQALPADAEATLEFASGRVAGRAFCNRFSAAIEREGPEFSVGETATTRMACPPHLLSLEATFLDILSKTNSATVAADGGLTIRAADGRTIEARRR
jgi:heat shock protein HslJ